MPNRMSDRMPDKESEDMPDRMSEDMPDRILIFHSKPCPMLILPRWAQVAQNHSHMSYMKKWKYILHNFS